MVLRVASIALVVLPLLFAASASAQTLRSPRLNAEAVLLLDADGRTIFEKNADLERAPASLVKLMTLYLAFEAIEHGRADVEDVVTVSAHAASESPRSRRRPVQGPHYRPDLRASAPGSV